MTLTPPCVVCRGMGYARIDDERSGRIWWLCSSHFYKLGGVLYENTAEVVRGEKGYPVYIPKGPFDLVEWLRKEGMVQKGLNGKYLWKTTAKTKTFCEGCDEIIDKCECGKPFGDRDEIGCLVVEENGVSHSEHRCFDCSQTLQNTEGTIFVRPLGHWIRKFKDDAERCEGGAKDTLLSTVVTLEMLEGLQPVSDRKRHPKKLIQEAEK